MIKIAKKDLKNIKVETNEQGGFTVWVLERKKINGKMRTIKHWIVDGSNIKNDGEIRLGSPDIWKINAKFDEEENAIFVTRD
jgi:hypothetical protein